MRKNNVMYYEKERKMNAIQKEELNNKCIDCKSENPEYISLNNAIFICKNCLKNHRRYSSNVSRIIKNDLKLLSLKEIQYIYFGGNKKMLEFMKYEYPKLIKLDPSFVYKTIAMEYYRNWLSYLVEGGKKPVKPDIEVAYNSIEDRKYTNKNYSTNNNSDVITIDFINDCYNYNDKYNHTITNFINKKVPEDKREEGENNNNLESNMKSRIQTDKTFYHKPPSSNLKDFLNYYKTINKNNYEKYINNQSNDFFSKTQTNFGINKNRANNNMDSNNNISRRKRNDIEDNNNKINQVDNIIEDNNRNNYNSRILKAFKTNNRIYMKPKHTFMKSFEKEKEKEKDNNENKDIDEDKNIKFIMVKKDKNDNSKYANVNANDNINYNKNQNQNQNQNEYMLFNNRNRRINDVVRSRYIKKFNNSFGNLHRESEDHNIKDKEEKEKEKEKENDRNITQDLYETDNTKSNINENSINNYSLNNIIFKKKNLKNNFYSNYDKRHNKNSSTVENSQFEIISKNDTTREDGKSYEESYDDTQNSIQTLPSNKSLRQFYSRHPRKMNRTKTKRRKLNESKREEKKERSKYEKLKREKSEIIRSLTILLKKKEQIKNEENKKKEIHDNDSDNDGDGGDNYKNKTIDSDDNRKKIFVNKIKNDELNRIILNENRRNRKSNDGEEYNNNEQRKIIFVKQNEDLIQKGENSIRSKYKNRRYRISTNF